MKAELINESISQLRKKGKKIYTNAFGHFVWEESKECIISDDSVLLFDIDHGVKRFFFYSVDLKDLCIIFKEFELNEKCTIEILSRNQDECKDLLEAVGFKCKSNLLRLSIKDIGLVLNKADGVTLLYEDGHGYTPEKKEAHEINQLLWKTFDTRVSHLLDDSEIELVIENGQFVVERQNGNLVSLLQYQNEPRKFYINQIINNAERKVIHSILIQELRKYYANGGRYVYSWVEQNNMASMKFHEKYGLKPDGLWNIVYVYE